MSTTPVPMPTLRLRLNDLITAAKEQWGTLSTRRTLTVMQVTQGLHVNQRTIEKYINDSGTRVQFDVLARICWYFGVSTDTVVVIDTDTTSGSADIELGRTGPPQGLPPVGAMRVLNFIPAEVEMQAAMIEEVTGWTQQSVDVLLSGGQRRVYRRTLETLLPVLNYTRVSQLLDVQVDLEAVDPKVMDLEQSVVIFEPRPLWLETDWRVLAAEWRRLGPGNAPRSGSVSTIDVAVIRYLAQGLPEQFGHYTSRFIMLAAAGMGITRSLLHQLARGEMYPDISANDVPPKLRDILDTVIDRNWHSTAALRLTQPG